MLWWVGIAGVGAVILLAVERIRGDRSSWPRLQDMDGAEWIMTTLTIGVSAILIAGCVLYLALHVWGWITGADYFPTEPGGYPPADYYSPSE